MYAEYLRLCGFRVQTATTTDEGQSRASDVDVVVTGIRVDGSYDGVALVQRLRAAGETARIPIIVLTACAAKSDQERAEAAGCNVFLRKPCPPDRLADETRSLIAARQLQRAAHAHVDGHDRRLAK